MRQAPVSREIFDAVVDERDCLLEEITQLKQVLVSDDDFPREWKIKLTSRKLLRHLLARKMVSKTSAYLALYDGSDGDGPSETILNVYICHLRKRLKPLGISITTHWGEGYSLTPEMKQRLRELIEAAQS